MYIYIYSDPTYASWSWKYKDAVAFVTNWKSCLSKHMYIYIYTYCHRRPRKFIYIYTFTYIHIFIYIYYIVYSVIFSIYIYVIMYIYIHISIWPFRLWCGHTFREASIAHQSLTVCIHMYIANCCHHNSLLRLAQNKQDMKPDW